MPQAVFLRRVGAEDSVDRQARGARLGASVTLQGLDIVRCRTLHLRIVVT
jgi:hypothetical protein